ncbi:MAG: spore cortex-lytic enzyme [Firmicutes bacterium]|nr:spore cortex-lytic enzyme [Bacillota bacterium]
MKKVCLKSILVLMVVMVVVSSSAFAESLLLKQGATGDLVYKLQSKLQGYGYYQSAPDGNFGAATRAAVVDFQLAVGLSADGVVGPATWQAIAEYNPAVSRGVDSRTGIRIVRFARQYLGTPYVWAGRSASGFDCSGFVSYVFGHFGVDLPRMADEQFDVGLAVSRQDIRPGDMVFFTTYEVGPSHVGIYVGGDYFIHASSGAGEVTLTSLSKPYYQERYLGARRVIR